MSVTTEQFRIGELARRTGSTPRAVRYYEELGLLPERGRARGGHRLYDADDEARLRDLLHIKELLGLSLNELRALVRGGSRAQPRCASAGGAARRPARRRAGRSCRRRCLTSRPRSLWSRRAGPRSRSSRTS